MMTLKGHFEINWILSCRIFLQILRWNDKQKLLTLTVHFLLTQSTPDLIKKIWGFLNLKSPCMYNELYYWNYVTCTPWQNVFIAWYSFWPKFGWTKWWALGSIGPRLRRPCRSLFRVQDTIIRGPDSESYANYVLDFFFRITF